MGGRIVVSESAGCVVLIEEGSEGVDLEAHDFGVFRVDGQ